MGLDIIIQTDPFTEKVFMKKNQKNIFTLTAEDTGKYYIQDL